MSNHFIQSRLHPNNLDNYNDSIEIISITIDPARDTVSHLSEWTEKRG